MNFDFWLIADLGHVQTHFLEIIEKEMKENFFAQSQIGSMIVTQKTPVKAMIIDLFSIFKFPVEILWISKWPHMIRLWRH